MLKRIGTDQLILGMYIHEFCGSWLDHPFVRVGGFLLSNPKDLDRVHGSSIREVWIDVSKGKDIPAHVKSVSREEADAEIEARLSTFGELPPEPAAPPIPKPPTVNQARLPAQLDTYYGTRPLHAVLERTAWHVAQHARQLDLVLGRSGVSGHMPLPAALLADLPLPKDAWDAEVPMS